MTITMTPSYNAGAIAAIAATVGVSNMQVKGNQHLVGDCNSSNCRIFQCKECGVEVENDEDEPIVCKECIAERGCVCTDAERILWIDCDARSSYPSPSRYSVQAKNLYKHWTRSPFSADERRNKGLVVMNIRCTCCSWR